MDEPELPADATDAQPASPPQASTRRGARRNHRQRGEQLLAAQRARLEQVEVELSTQLDQLSDLVAGGLSADARHEFDRRAAALAEQAQEQHEAGETLRLQIDNLRQQRQELDRARTEMAASSSDLHAAQAALQTARRQHEAEVEKVAKRWARCEQLEQRLDRQSEELERRRDETKSQRRRIAQELKAQRAAQQLELDRLRRQVEELQSNQQRSFDQSTRRLQREREELERTLEAHQQDIHQQRAGLADREAALAAKEHAIADKAASLVEKEAAVAAAESALTAKESALGAKASASAQAEQLTEQSRRLAADLAEARESAGQAAADLIALAAAHDQLRQSHDELRQTHGELRQSHDAISAERDQWQSDREALEEQLRALDEQSAALPPIAAADLAGDLAGAEWRAEREMLIARLEDAESRLSEVDPNRVEDLQRRCELAIEETREVKRRNEELEDRLAGSRAAGSSSAYPATGLEADAPDWESTKRRMLESLQADPVNGGGDAGDGQSNSDRLSIESTIQLTDEIVAQKDRELAELRMLLSQQSSSIGSVAVGAAAIAGVLGQDELIRQEREKLRLLQEEWRDKLRKAEIDVSVERARIARQRAEIEEKLATIESHRASQATDADGAKAADPTKKPPRGRWLARLGLKDEDAK